MRELEFREKVLGIGYSAMKLNLENLGNHPSCSVNRVTRYNTKPLGKFEQILQFGIYFCFKIIPCLFKIQI